MPNTDLETARRHHQALKQFFVSQFLRQQMLNALELFASRLYSLEALRRASHAKGMQWTTRSSTAPI